MLRKINLIITVIVVFCVWSLAQASPLRHKAATTQTNSQPTATQIVEKFINAVGGRAAWLRIKTQHALGTSEVIPLGVTATYEIYCKAPNQSFVVMRSPRGEFKVGFDGQKGWTQTPQNRAQYDPEEKQLIERRDSDFYKYLHFSQHFPTAKVVGIEKVKQAKAYVVEATPAGTNSPERLYFDIQTGLLILRDLSRKGEGGADMLDVVYYDDYRQIGEIKIAFTTTTVQGGVTIIFKHTEAENNVPVDDAIFNIPQRNETKSLVSRLSVF